MFDVASPLRGALAGANERLALDAQRAALSQTIAGRTANDTTMGALAQSAIFSEALFSAIHARFAEIKAVTK